MIRFLGKIRRELLNNPLTGQNLRRYLLYAAGEILLVVIGILIALEINDYQKWKTDRAEEISYLSRLLSDLEKDYIDITEANNFAFRRIMISTWVLELLGDNTATFEPKIILKKGQNAFPAPSDWTSDSLGLALGRLWAIRIFDHSDITYQEMVSASKIPIIRDLDLRIAINDHYAAARKALDVNYWIADAQEKYMEALKKLGITPYRAALMPDLYEHVKNDNGLMVEIQYVRDMAFRHLSEFEQPERGLLKKTQDIIQKINEKLTILQN